MCTIVSIISIYLYITIKRNIIRYEHSANNIINVLFI